MHVARSFTERDIAAIRRDGARLPTHLYRYTGIRGERFDWLRETLLESRLHFPMYSELNDPWDGAIPFSFEATPSEARAYWEDFVRMEGLLGAAVRDRVDALAASAADPAQAHALSEHLLEMYRAYRVKSFSEDGDNEPMWRQYADEHAGVCLQFRSIGLLRIGRCLGPVPVTYQRTIASVPWYRTTWMEKVAGTLMTKQEQWQHEHEWRLVALDEDAERTFEPSTLDAITLGRAVDVEEEHRLRSLVAQRRDPIVVLRAH